MVDNHMATYLKMYIRIEVWLLFAI